MNLILGGAYQGKLTWAAEKYGLSPDDIWDLTRGIPETPHCCYIHLEALTWEAAKAEETAVGLLEALRPHLAETILISREIGAGVVPMDATERLWREIHGQVLQALAKQAHTVTRIFCGLPEVLK